MSLENRQSPWRSLKLDEYAAEHRPREPDGTVFTQILRSHEDERYFVVKRGTHFSVLLHHNPYNNGHLLLVSHRPVAGYRELTSLEQGVLAQLIDETIGWLREALRAEGVNVAMNEGDFDESREPKHLLVHVVPRWSGDTNFMTAANNTRVIPESLEDTYDRLRRYLAG